MIHNEVKIFIFSRKIHYIRGPLLCELLFPKRTLILYDFRFLKLKIFIIQNRGRKFGYGKKSQICLGLFFCKLEKSAEVALGHFGTLVVKIVLKLFVKMKLWPSAIQKICFKVI